MKFVAFVLGSLLAALFNGFLGYLLLETVFDLGFWVWVGIAFFGAQVARSGYVIQEVLDKQF